MGPKRLCTRSWTLRLDHEILYSTIMYFVYLFYGALMLTESSLLSSVSVQYSGRSVESPSFKELKEFALTAAEQPRLREKVSVIFRLLLRIRPAERRWRKAILRRQQSQQRQPSSKHRSAVDAHVYHLTAAVSNHLCVGAWSF